MQRSRFLVILGFIILGIFSRLLPHPPNFTAINAISLFGACYTGSLWLSLIIILTTMLTSDLILGFHSMMAFVYFTISLTTLLGYKLDKEKPWNRLPEYCVASSLLFFFIVNFGVWLVDGFYPYTLSGLVLCYVAALPFLATQIIGDLFYAILLFGCFRFFEKQFPATACAKIPC